MAGRKRAGAGSSAPKGRDAGDNDFSKDEVQEFFDSLDEINERMKSDAAAGRADMNAVYDKMVDVLDITKESATFLWARHNTERRFENRAKKMDATDRKSLERFAKPMAGTPMGDWATQAAGLIDDKPKKTKTEH